MQLVFLDADTTNWISYVRGGVKAGAKSTAEIAAEWRGQVMSTARWVPALNQAGTFGTPLGAGQTRGFFASSDIIPGRRAYLKPRVFDPNNGRAAREKIASDLGYDLGVMIPPVLLANRNEPPHETRVCLSLVMHTGAWSWAEIAAKLSKRPAPKALEVKKMLEDAQLKLARAASQALVFDTWVGQEDHGPHNDHNIVFGYETKKANENSYILLDYERSFGIAGRWEDSANPEYYTQCKVAPLHPMMMNNLDIPEISNMIDKIEAVADSLIDEIVGRIPISHIRDNERRAIIEGLKARRGLVRPTLAPVMHGGSP